MLLQAAALKASKPQVLHLHLWRLYLHLRFLDAQDSAGKVDTSVHDRLFAARSSSGPCQLLL